MVAREPVSNAPCMAPQAPDSAWSSISFTGWPKMFFMPAAAHSSTWSAMGLEGVMG